MQRNFTALFGLSLLLGLSSLGAAQDLNIEDEPIPDDLAPAQPTAPQPQPAPVSPVPPQLPTPQLPTPQPGAASTDVDALRARQERLERELQELRDLINRTPVAPAPNIDETPTTTTTAPNAGRNYLQLPDISLIGQAQGLLSSDKRDEDRKTLRLSEGEIAIQGYVYPNVRAEAYIVGAPAEGEFGFEEGFLSFNGVTPLFNRPVKNLNILVGRKFTPFGRTGEQHSHSWLYARQLIPRRNLVAEEALIGDGVLFRYLLPTGKKLYANLDLGVFNGEGTEDTLASDPSAPLGTGVTPRGIGAAYNSRFYQGRLYLGYPLGRDTELEFGSSFANGRVGLTNDDEDPSSALEFNGRAKLFGLDAGIRRYFGGDRRLLLRTEYFRYKPEGGLTAEGGVGRAKGYYGLANYRFNRFNDVGLLYESSEFPQAPGQEERAYSLIYTRPFTEQFYVRLHGTRGTRPGEGRYNELRLQFTFGIGPHTHNLE